MKKSTFFLFLLNALFLSSQVNLTTGFGKTQPGYSYRIGAEYEVNEKFSAEAGIKIIQWNYILDNQNFTFKNRFKPQSFIEYFGFYGSLNYNIFTYNEFVSSFVFYDVLFTNASLYHEGFFIHGSTIDPITGQPIDLFTNFAVIFEPTIAFENFIGGGINIQLFNKLIFSQKIGIGFCDYYDIDPHIIGNPNDIGEFGFDWNFTLKYHLTNKKPKNK